MEGKIFQIGFNKCGTTSLYKLFKEYCNPSNRLKCVHWDGGRVATAIEWHITNNKKPILGRYHGFDYLGDMEYENEEGKKFIHMKYFKNLDTEYPNSRFILNVRPIDEWIESRKKHHSGNYLKHHAKTLRISEEKVIELWKEQWENHMYSVCNYFAHRTNSLLIYDIKNDPFSKITDFFNDLEFTIDRLPHQNKGF